EDLGGGELAALDRQPVLGGGQLRLGPLERPAGAAGGLGGVLQLLGLALDVALELTLLVLEVVSRREGDDDATDGHTDRGDSGDQAATVSTGKCADHHLAFVRGKSNELTLARPHPGSRDCERS